MSAWISVDDRLPPILKDTGKSFIALWLDEGETIDHLCFDGEDYWNQNSFNHSDKPTHWMPLPEPPSED